MHKKLQRSCWQFNRKILQQCNTQYCIRNIKRERQEKCNKIVQQKPNGAKKLQEKEDVQIFNITRQTATVE